MRKIKISRITVTASKTKADILLDVVFVVNVYCDLGIGLKHINLFFIKKNC
jgi:hypothetical protein